MNTLVLRIIIYNCVFIAIFIVAMQIAGPNPAVNLSSLGNELSAYFYQTNTNTPLDLHRGFKARTADLNDNQLKEFYNKLNWQRNQNLIDYTSDYFHTWNQINWNGTNKNNYLLYWQNVRPIAQSLYFTNLEKIDNQHPVIHFRCSDSPFNKAVASHLPKASSVKWMAEQIKAKGFDKIILLSCNTHKSKESQQNVCEKYTNFYINIFNNQNISVDTQCNSILHDFSLMVYSPLLISLNGSSYSFMAGISKDPESYVSCNLGIEINGKYYAQTDGDWIFDQQEPLLHKDVVDYSDTATVISKLND